MKQNYLRRNFIRNSLLASGGLILYPTISSAASTFSRTERNLSNHTDIRQKLFGKQVEITGQIFDSTGKNTLSGVKVEFCHLSPNSKKINHKGSLITNENGSYKLVTDYPNREYGKHSTIHFKVFYGEKLMETELKFSDFSAHITHIHWENNNILPPDLLFPKMEKILYKTKLNFNFKIN